MNKSKFLKKSLAMVLAIMMVVAMIPLSASAAEAPKLAQAWVSTDGGTTWTEAAIDGTSIQADVDNTATSLDFKLLVAGDSTNVGVEYIDQSVIPAAPKTVSGASGIFTTGSSLNVQNYVKDGKYQVSITVTNGAMSTPYTLVATPVEVSTDTSVKAFELVGQYGSTMIDNANQKIEVTVPYRYTDADIKVKKIELTADNAVMLAHDGFTKVTAGVNGTTLGITAIPYKDTITVKAGGATASYELVIKKAVGYENFTVEGATAMKVFTDGTDSAVAVILPYGYCNDNKDASGDVTVKPTFAMDYPSAETYADKNQTAGASTASQEKLTSGETEVKFDAANVSKYDATAVDLAECDSLSDLGLSPSTVAMKTTVKYVESDKRDFDIYFVEPQQNPAAEITELTIGNETATIEGNTISITLPDGTNAGAITAADIVITGSKNATITVPAQAGTTFTEVSGVFTGTGSTLNAKENVVIRVVSEDRETTADYTLKVTVNDKFEAPVLKTLTLQDPDGNNYEAVLSGKTFTFQLPYAEKANSDLATWKLFYTKTVGASVASLGKSGASLAGGEGYLPVTFDGVTPGTKIKVSAVNSATGSSETNFFDIIIARKTPDDTKKLQSISLTDAANQAFKNVTNENTYKATIDNSNKAVITLPFSVYENHVVSGHDLGVMLQAGNENSGVFFLSGDTLTKVSAIVEDQTTYPASSYDFANMTSYTAGHNPLTVVVLSERAVVDNNLTAWRATGSYSGVKSNNPTGYAEYKLYVDQAKAQTGYALNGLQLIDDDGNTANLTVKSGLISGTVPYRMVGKKLYLDYNASPKAVLTNVDSVSGTLPAGTIGTFVDGGARDSEGELDTTTTTINNPYIKVTSNGTVELYKADGITKAATDNQLYVTNEDGLEGHTAYTMKLTVAKANTEAQFKSFSINNVNGVIDNTANTIKVSLPYGSEVTSLKPVYTLSDGASTTFKSGKEAFNFSVGRNFTVTAEDGVTKKTYAVTVTVADQFKDVSTDDWFYNDVMTAANNGWITGTGNGNFSPANGMKRGDFALMITRVINADLSAYEGETAFPDIPADKYYAAAVAYCVDKGYLSGYEDGKFYGERTIDRNAMAKVICEVKGLDQVTSTGSPFADDAKIPTWAKGYVYACAEAGIILGDTNNNFNGSKIAKRSEAAAVLVRAFA